MADSLLRRLWALLTGGTERREPGTDPVERASRDSFPASDAPSWTAPSRGTPPDDG